MSLQCFHKGCGQKYDEANNQGEACQYHPGAPVFHDATKKWSCCGKWSTDFSEFLSIKGCTKGLHSNEKPVEAEKPTRVVIEERVEKIPEPLPKVKKERPCSKEAKISLNVNVTSSAKSALEKKLEALAVNTSNIESESDCSIRPGAACKHNGCQAKYDPDSELGKCVFHPGYPVFHEGCKFWSCCNIKRTEFSDFLNQVGCATGEHVWTTKEDEKKKQVNCRVDHFQTGNMMTINVYAKAVVPDLCVVKANKVSVDVDVTFEGGESKFTRSFILAGTIDPSKSVVKLTGTKVEISLKKAEIESWPSLEL